MSEQIEYSEVRALIDRVVNYSDALAAVMVVAASGLAIALADPDIRSSITQSAYFGIVIGNFLMGIGVSLLLRLLRRWELDLVEDLPTTYKIRKYSRAFYLARHVVVWFCIFQNTAVLLMSGISVDSIPAA